MENWVTAPVFYSCSQPHIFKGLITGRTSAFLIDPEKSDLAGRQRVAATQSHEVAHMWFGDIVTMKWWDNLYLNEGIIQFSYSLPISSNRCRHRFRYPGVLNFYRRLSLGLTSLLD